MSDDRTREQARRWVRRKRIFYMLVTGVVLGGLGGLFGQDWERRQIDRYVARSGDRPDELPPPPST